MTDIATIMQTSAVIPVLVIDDAATAKPLAQALVAGGLRVLEVTLRTPAAMEAIAEMKTVPGAIVGGLLIGIIEMLFGGYVSTAFQHVSAFCIIIIVLFVRPYGLFGHKPTTRV